MNLAACFPRLFACFVLALLLCVAVGAENASADTKPILVVTGDGHAPKANPFGAYLAEILRAEGLVAFDAAKKPTAELLAGHQTVVLAEMKLGPTEEDLLRQFVRDGGLLIAMRPDTGLADVFGVRAEGTREEKLLQYFAVAGNLTDAAPLPDGLGIVTESLQYHGEATNYALAGARSLAFLYDDANTPSSNPAVTMNRFGKGHAVAFAFDLAKSIVLMRQGNPEWQNTEGDGVRQYRPMDMFWRADGRTYFDLARLAIPQADESQRMFANIVLSLSGKPLPRVWYLPKMHKTLMVNTGDAESQYETLIDPVLDDCAKYGGCYSVYLRHGPSSPGIEKTTPEKEASWRKAGHEVGVHMCAGGPEGKGAVKALDQAYEKIIGDLKAKFGHGSRTARNHSIDWTGWVTMAGIEAKHGTRMDMNYYHYFNTDNSPATNGYFNGTGLPQRFIDATGRVLPIYQTTTQWPDEWFADKKLTVEQTVDIMKGMFEAAENGYYSAFVNNIHPPRYNDGDTITPKWPAEIWKYCQEKGIPSWSGAMLLDFVEARAGARFDNLVWRVDANQVKSELKFDFHAPVAGQDLTVMLPVAWSGRRLGSVLADGKPVDVKTERIKGIEYAMFTTIRSRANIVANYTTH